MVFFQGFCLCFVSYIITIEETKMKSLFILVILVVVGILLYNHFLAGPVSEEETELKVLERDFDSALNRVRGSERALALSGMDTTADMDDALRNVEKIKEDLISLKERIEDEKLLRKAEALEQRIIRYLRENR
jgi:hypothetical protein